MKGWKKVFYGTVLVLTPLLLWGCSADNADPSPYEEVNTMEGVSLELEKDVYDSEGDTFILHTVNESENERSYGIAFTLEKKVDGEWYVVEPREEMAFILIAHILEPVESAQDELKMEYFEPLETGEYRVVREIEGEVLTAEFAVR